MQTVAFDGSQPARAVDQYIYTVTSDQWSWSDGMYELHGYHPDDIKPSTEIQTALARVAEHREAIDEAKGMVIAATGCNRLRQPSSVRVPTPLLPGRKRQSQRDR